MPAEEMCQGGTAGAKASITPAFPNYSGEEADDRSPLGNSGEQEESLR